MNTKRQGDVGVGVAIAHYISMGYTVCYPLTDAARYDLVVDKEGILFRVQVKTSNSIKSSGVCEVQLRTTGGNQSWKGKITKLSPLECDLVFICVRSGSNYEFPVTVLEGMSTVSVGNKYDEYKL